jgi:ribosomal subunit interface protein
MNIELTTREAVVSTEVQSRLEKKLEKLLERTNKETPVRVMVEESRGRFNAHISMSLMGKPLVGESENKNMVAALDDAVEKVERQFNKLYERVQDHR